MDFVRNLLLFPGVKELWKSVKNWQNYRHVFNECYIRWYLWLCVQREEFTSFWEQYHHRPLTGRNHILASVCPQVYGLYVVKLAVALVLIGGVQVYVAGISYALCGSWHFVYLFSYGPVLLLIQETDELLTGHAEHHIKVLPGKYANAEYRRNDMV